MNYLACFCPHCQQKLEYPVDGAGRAIDCPGCNGPMTLPGRPEKKSFLSMLSDKIGGIKQSMVDKSKLKAALMDVVADGILTEEEATQVRALMDETGLTASDMDGWREELFRCALQSLERWDVSFERLAGIRAIQNFLGLQAKDVPQEMARLGRYEQIAIIRNQGPPPIAVSNIVLGKNEQVYWVEPARLFEEKIVAYNYSNTSHAVSFRVMKGVRFGLGGGRTKIRPDTADVVVSDGNFVISNKRLIFQGSQKSFATKLENILDINNYSDGIIFSEANREKKRKIRYLNANNGDLIIEVLTHVFSNRV